MKVEYDPAKDEMTGPNTAFRFRRRFTLIGIQRLNAKIIGLIMEKFDSNIHDDNPPLDADFMAGMKPSRRGRPKLAAPKVEVKIRLDANTVEYLRGSGPGWQTRVNALLAQLVANAQI